MTETALTDAQANALSGATDNDADLTYPAIGESPYHTTMYRFLQRLGTIAKAVNELRVYKDGDLTFGVRSGRASGGSVAYAYAGAIGQSLTDDATNTVYLVINGSDLDLTVNTTGLPDPATTAHLPLATIDTGTASIGGISGQYDVTDVTDLRGAALFRVVGA